MIDTLRLARRWKEAQNDPERMVEALAEELDRETVGKTDLRELEARLQARLEVFQSEFEGFKAEIRREFESFKAEMRSKIARLRNQVLAEAARHVHRARHADHLPDGLSPRHAPAIAA